MEKEPSLQLGDIDGSLYEALGIDFLASRAEIKDAYRRKAKEWHPDRHHGDEGAKETFQHIARAYQVLTDPATREQHDLRFGCLDRITSIQDYLDRYFFLLLSPQGLGLDVDHRSRRSPQQFSTEMSERVAAPISAS